MGSPDEITAAYLGRIVQISIGPADLTGAGLDEFLPPSRRLRVPFAEEADAEHGADRRMGGADRQAEA
ncbi:hypothetical protein D3C80_1910730 [compost metagenome]